MEPMHQRLVLGDQSPLNKIVSDRTALSGIRTQVLKHPTAVQRRKVDTYMAVARHFQKGAYNDDIARIGRLVAQTFIDKNYYNDYDKVVAKDVSTEKLSFLAHQIHLCLVRLMRSDTVSCSVNDTGTDRISAMISYPKEFEITWREGFFKFNEDSAVFVCIPIGYINRILLNSFRSVPIDLVDQESVVQEITELFVLQFQDDFLDAFLAGLYTAYNDSAIMHRSKMLFSLLPEIKTVMNEETLDAKHQKIANYLNVNKETAQLFRDIKNSILYECLESWHFRIFNPMELQSTFDYPNAEIVDFVERVKGKASNEHFVIDRMSYITSPEFTGNPVAFAIALKKLMPFILLSSLISRGSRSSMIGKFMKNMRRSLSSMENFSRTLIARRYIENLIPEIESYIDLWESNSHPMFLNDETVSFLFDAIEKS